MSKELYVTVVDERVRNAILMLLPHKQADMLSTLIIMLIETNTWDECEHEVLDILADQNTDETIAANGLIEIITTTISLILNDRGIKLVNNDLPTLYYVVVTFNELIDIDPSEAEVVVSYITSLEIDNEYAFAQIVEHYNEIDVLEFYNNIEYITPTLIGKIEHGITNLLEDTDDTSLSNDFDPILYNSIIYKEFTPTDKVDGSLLMDSYYKIFDYSDDITLLATELYVVIRFSKDVENSHYYLQHELTDDLLSYTSGETLRTAKANAVIEESRLLIKDI